MNEIEVNSEGHNNNFIEKINIKLLLVLHLIIWLVFSIKNGALWYYLEPEKLDLIIKYKCFELVIISSINSYVIFLLHKLTTKLSKNYYQLLFGFLMSIFVSLSFYVIISGISVRGLIFSQFKVFNLVAYLKGLNFNIFLITLLNIPAYLLTFWEKYKDQILKNTSLLKKQKEREEKERKEFSDKIFLSNRHLPNYIELSSIKYIQADAYISHIVTEQNKKITLDRTLKKWETELPQNRFPRIHKSIIVNTDYIHKIEKLPNQTYQIHLKESEEVLNMSRRFGKDFISNPQYHHLF